MEVRYEARKFGSVLRAAAEGHIEGDLLFSDDNHLDVRNTPLASSTWSGSEGGRFTEAELKPCKRMC